MVGILLGLSEHGFTTDSGHHVVRNKPMNDTNEPPSFPPSPASPEPTPPSDFRPETAAPPVEQPSVWQQIRNEVTRVFIGQDAVVDQVLAALIAGGHILLEGKPGLGKTHLVLALSRTFGGNFQRIQFTPDLMPSDVTGHSLFDMSTQQFRLRKGPVFTNLLWPTRSIARRPRRKRLC